MRESLRIVVISAVGVFCAGLVGAARAQVFAQDSQFPFVDSEMFPEFDADKAALGHKLFYDPVLSGNKNIACATCHHPSLGTSDGMSLSLGEGGIGLGPSRVVDAANPPKDRIPRNAPALFNLGAAEFQVLFHDGRVEYDLGAENSVLMPEGRALDEPLPSALAAQAILPVLSADEMAGHAGENGIADLVASDAIHGEDGAWAMIAGRLTAIEPYRAQFAEIYGEESVSIYMVADSLAHFIGSEFRAYDSLYEQFLRGERESLPELAFEGEALFFGEAGCANCHSGPFFTDHQFHAIAMPQLGPGKGEGEAAYRDIGRAAVTGDPDDAYKFRTPSLRNVALTAPYGHSGAFGRLEDVVRHHLDPVASLFAYDPAMARLHEDFTPHDRPDLMALENSSEMFAIAEANELEPVSLSDREVAAIVAFLHSLTDEAGMHARLGIPETVPSGLPLDTQ